jgi:glucose-6-phosphate dehydrogenase assembly protein OpcA
VIDARVATVVVVGPRDRIDEAAAALSDLGKQTGLRRILIAEGRRADRPVHDTSDEVFLDGLRPEFINNAVAALRLSSLPTMVWWRGGSEDAVPGLAALADRLVLDAADPSKVWKLVPQLAKHTAVTDLRWTRLTRWRSLLAQFFDVDEVREAASNFSTLAIAAGDPFAARLFAGWLATSLPQEAKLRATLAEVRGGSTIESVTLTAGALDLALRLAPHGQCVESVLRTPAGTGMTRTVALGSDSLATLIGEELRIRSRDLPFERAVRAAGGKL